MCFSSRMNTWPDLVTRMLLGKRHAYFPESGCLHLKKIIYMQLCRNIELSYIPALERQIIARIDANPAAEFSLGHKKNVPG